MTYSLDDITIIPAIVTDIEHRSECNVYNEDEMLPLFTAPMSSVINAENWEQFSKQKINTIIPRSVAYNTRVQLMDKTFVAWSLKEFEEFIETPINILPNQTLYWCIDIANGHMKKLLTLCSKCKELYGGQVLLMTGNIANDETYYEYAKSGIDFVRCSIGSGSVCTTSANSGVHMPMASLIRRCAEHKLQVQKAVAYAQSLGQPSQFTSIPYIIADGGFDNFDKINKALALGADYVMLGKLLSQTTIACGVQVHGERVYYGMSTKRAQTELKGIADRTSEGIEVRNPITCTLEQWVANFIHYLQTAMSYTNSRTLEEFKQVKTDTMSQNAHKNYYK